MHSVINRIASRSARLIYYTQELLADSSAVALTTRRAAIASMYKQVHDAW